MDFEAALHANGNGGAELAVIPKMDMTAAKEALERYGREIETMKDAVTAMTVQTAEQEEAAVVIGGAAAKLKKAIGAKTKELTADADEYVSGVRNFAKRFTEGLAEVESLAKQKISRYREIQEIARREAEKKALEETKRIQAEIDKEAKDKGVEPVKLETPIVPAAPAKVRTDTGVTSYQTKRWIGEVFDPSRVPIEYCSPDKSKIDDAVKSGVRQIPGVHIKEITETRFRNR
jgi:hypothetical protein